MRGVCTFYFGVQYSSDYVASPFWLLISRYNLRLSSKLSHSSSVRGRVEGKGGVERGGRAEGKSGGGGWRGRVGG